MQEPCLIDSLAELLCAPERWMIRDDDGKLHELTDGKKGVPVLMTAKQEIYKLYFGKERISATDLMMLDEVHSLLMKFVWENFSHKVKTESQDELAAVLEKYKLKKVNKREKKQKK